MSKPSSKNTFQVAFKIPKDQVTLAERLARRLSRRGDGIPVTRTEVMRSALEKGLEGMKEMESAVFGKGEER